MAKKTKTFIVSDREIVMISDYLEKTHPWICRDGNEVYTAELTGIWKLKIDESFAEEVEKFIKPVNVKGLEF